jgi:hypothetical protein
MFSTVSIAIPGSVIANAQSPELRTFLAGQIARAAALFHVDEVVVYADDASSDQAEKRKGDDDHAKATRASDPNLFLVRVLQYLEMPQVHPSFFLSYLLTYFIIIIIIIIIIVLFFGFGFLVLVFWFCFFVVLEKSVFPHA